MLGLITRFITRDAHRAGVKHGRELERAYRDSEIDALKSDIREERRKYSELMQTEARKYSDLQKYVSKTVTECQEEKLKTSREHAKEIYDLLKYWKTEIQNAHDIRDKYSKKFSQLCASELFINNHIETRAQEFISVGCRFRDEIETIDKG